VQKIVLGVLSPAAVCTKFRRLIFVATLVKRAVCAAVDDNFTVSQANGWGLYGDE